MKLLPLLAIAFTSLLAPAQTGDVSYKPITLALKDTALREALKQIFKQVGVSYSIEPNMSGAVTVSVKDKALVHVLRDVMLQVDGIYFIEADIYQFRRIVPYTKPAPEADTGKPSMSQQLRRLRMAPKDFGSSIIVLGAGPPRKADVQLVLKEMFNLARVDYWMDRTLHGLVDVPPNYTSDLDAALTAITKQIGARWYKENGVYVVRRAAK